MFANAKIIMIQVDNYVSTLVLPPLMLHLDWGKHARYVCVSISESKKKNMALIRGTRRAIITDESVNSYKFWTLTSGIDMSLYTENPILLWMHKRADEVLPIGVMQDIKLENGAYTGLPAFDDTDPFAMKLYNKYEGGMLNMFSAGLEPVEAQTSGKFLKDKAPCLTKSRLLEVTLCDIGSNRNAHKVKLYNKGKELELKNADELIKLFNDNNETDMIIIPKGIAELLKLTDSATEAEVITALKAQNELVLTLTTERDKAKADLKLLQDNTQSAKIIALVDTAAKEKKITEAQKPEYITLATANYEAVEKIFKGMPAHVTLQSSLETGNEAVNSIELASLLKLTDKELFTTGKSERLKELSLPHYKTFYKNYTGFEYKDEA